MSDKIKSAARYASVALSAVMLTVEVINLFDKKPAAGPISDEL